MMVFFPVMNYSPTFQSQNMYKRLLLHMLNQNMHQHKSTSSVKRDLENCEAKLDLVPASIASLKEENTYF